MDRFSDVEVRRLPTVLWGGAMNMALDTVAAETVAEGGPASVRVYGWKPSTLSLGYAQDIDTIDRAFCADEGIEITRRPTGGGGIYHDRRGDIAYSIAVPRETVPEDLTASYQLLCEPLSAFFETIDVSVGFAQSGREAAYKPSCYLRGLHPAHDLVVATAGGDRKISGNAQHRQRDAVVQHGSILYDMPIERHAGCFVDPAADARAFANRTTTVTDHADVARERAIDALECALTTAFDASAAGWTDGELQRARELVDERFAADEWVRQRPVTRA